MTGTNPASQPQASRHKDLQAIHILDEPINGLDPSGVHWLRSFLRQFADQGGAALVSSHVLAEVEQSVDRVLIINQGRLLADQPMTEITRDGGSLEHTYLTITTRAVAL